MTNLRADLFVDEVIWWEVSDGMRKYKMERTKTVKQNCVSKDPVEVTDMVQTSEVMQTNSIREGRPLLRLTHCYSPVLYWIFIILLQLINEWVLIQNLTQPLHIFPPL